MNAGIVEPRATDDASYGPTRRQRALLLAAVAWIPLELAVVTAASARAPTPDARWLFAAAAADIAILAGALVTWLARRAGGVRRLGVSPRRVLRATAVALVVAGAAARVAGVPLGGAAFALVAAAEVAVLALVVRAVLAERARRRGAAAAAAGEAGEASEASEALGRAERDLAAALPAPVARVLVAELRVALAALRAITRREVRAAGDGWGATATSAYRGVLAFLLVVTVIEMPALHVLLHAKLGSGYGGVHAAIVLLHVYTAVWLVGDHRLMAESRHRLREDALEIALGARWRGAIPYAQVARVTAGEVETEDPLAPRRKRARGAKRTVDVTPMDAPNVVIELRETVVLEGPFGMKREASCVRLYVDDPQGFAKALAERTG